MEEININLDSVPHNNVSVDLNSVGNSTGDINVMSDSSSIGLDLLVNKKKVGGASSPNVPSSPSAPPSNMQTFRTMDGSGTLYHR